MCFWLAEGYQNHGGALCECHGQIFLSITKFITVIQSSKALFCTVEQNQTKALTSSSLKKTCNTCIMICPLLIPIHPK